MEATRATTDRSSAGGGKPTTDLTFIDRTPSPGTYRFRVRAIDLAGNKSAKSPPVSVWVFR